MFTVTHHHQKRLHLPLYSLEWNVSMRDLAFFLRLYVTRLTTQATAVTKYR